MKRITLLLSTAREGRRSAAVFEYLRKRFSDRSEARLTACDIRDLLRSPQTIPPWDPQGADSQDTEWKKIVLETDAFVFVIPEYNHGYPGEWKLLMDTLYKEYVGREVFIVGVSDGSFAGVRGADHMKPVLVELGLVVRRQALYVGKIKEVFDENGRTHDLSFQERAQKFVDEVLKGD